MESAELQNAVSLFRSLPHLGSVDSIERLGGLTNKVYRVVSRGKTLCLRVPGLGTQEYINRKHEALAAREVARVGVGAPVIYFDDKTGVSVTTFLAETVPMSPSLFAERRGAPARAGDALRKLHASDAVFSNRFDPFKLIDEYINVLDTKSANVPDGYLETMTAFDKARAALQAHPLPLAPCHCDPMTENFLDTGSRMWIVDWEYSGMNDPMWDLGDLSVEASFSPQQEHEMVCAYFSGTPRASELGRIQIYKAICDLLWTLWGLIQHANENPSEDFWAYAINRFERCRALVSSPSFTQSVESVQLG